MYLCGRSRVREKSDGVDVVTERERNRQHSLTMHALYASKRSPEEIRISESEGRKEAEMVLRAEETARRNRGQKN